MRAMLPAAVVLLSILPNSVFAEDTVNLTSCVANNVPAIEAALDGLDLDFNIQSFPFSEAIQKISTAFSAGEGPQFVVDCPIDFASEMRDAGFSQPWPAEVVNLFPANLVGPNRTWIPTSIDVGVICLNKPKLDELGFATGDGTSSADLINMVNELSGSRPLGELLRMPHALHSKYGYNWFRLLADTVGLDALNTLSDVIAGEPQQVFVDYPAPHHSFGVCERVAASQVAVGFSSWLDAAPFASTDDTVIRLPADGTWVDPLVAFPAKGVDPSIVEKVGQALARLVSDTELRSATVLDQLNLPVLPGVDGVVLLPQDLVVPRPGRLRRLARLPIQVVNERPSLMQLYPLLVLPQMRRTLVQHGVKRKTATKKLATCAISASER